MAQIAPAPPARLAALLGPARAAHRARLEAAAAAASRPGRLRLTPLGRIVLVGAPLMLAAMVMLVVAGAFTSPVAASSVAEFPFETTSVTVLEGETLWSLAAELVPERDPREVIGEIVELNNLGGSTIVPGQRLFIPTGG